MPNCGRCGQSKYSHHEATAPNASVPTAAECEGYTRQWPCDECGWECELHEKEAPHGHVDFNCPACVPPQGFIGGGGGFGGGGATGGW